MSEDDFDEPADDFDEDADDSEDSEDGEDEENEVDPIGKKDYSSIPIELKITAQILPSKNEGELSINVNGLAGPHVSSGSMFGVATSIVGDQTAAIEQIKQIVKDQEKWFGCYNRPVRSKLVINDVPTEVNGRSLNEWFK